MVTERCKNDPVNLAPNGCLAEIFGRNPCKRNRHRAKSGAKKEVVNWLVDCEYCLSSCVGAELLQRPM